MQEHKTPIASGFIGGAIIGIMGVVLPPIMFWGEFEINTLADNLKPLPHIWPKGGIYGMQPFYNDAYPWWLCILICFAKMHAISITVLSGQLSKDLLLAAV